MSERVGLIAALITNRPLCVTCIAEKCGLPTDETESFLHRVLDVLSVARGVDRCRACGIFTEVYSMFPND